MKNTDISQSQIFKVMLIGDISTGKTSFLTQLMYQTPQKLPKQTQQLSFFTLRISNPIPTIIQVWDSPGDQRYYFKSIALLQRFKSVLIFIDLTNQHTFNRAKIIMDRMQIIDQKIIELKVYPGIDVHLVETKLDIVQKMPYKRKIMRQNMVNLVKERKGKVFQFKFQNGKIEEIIEEVVIFNSEKKSNQQKQNKSSHQRKIFKLSQNDNKQNNQSKSSNNNDNQFCECIIA